MKKPIKAMLACFLYFLCFFGFAFSEESLTGPGLPNQEFAQEDLFKELYQFHFTSQEDPGNKKGANLVAMHKGWLFLVYAEDSGKKGGGIAFYDISDPRNPEMIHAQDVTSLRESHGFGFYSHNGRDYCALQATTGFQIWDFTDVRAPQLVKDFDGIEGGDYGGVWSVFWQAPYAVLTRGDKGFSIVDTRDMANPEFVNFEKVTNNTERFPVSETGGFKLGPVYVIGNLMVTSNMGTSDNPGYATIDISDPKNPVLLDSKTDVSCYSIFVNGNRIYCAGANEDAKGKVVVHDISDPTDIKYVGESEVVGKRGEYLHVQDEFVHMGVENKYAKVHKETFELVDNSFQLSGQEGFANPLGNIVMVTDDHSKGSSLVPHQSEKDLTPPVVNMANPKNGDLHLPVTSRIGFSFTDQIDMQTVNQQNFTVRPLEGEKLDGYYSSQVNIVNFTPREDLEDDTVYEVILKKGGIKDYAGNSLDEDYVMYFSTGGTIPTTKLRNNSLSGQQLKISGSTQGISFELSPVFSKNPVEIKILDLKGNVIESKTISNMKKWMWNGNGIDGNKVESGVYLALVNQAGLQVSQKFYWNR